MISLATSLFAEIDTSLIAALAFWGVVKRYGRNTALYILIGSIAWTTPIETLGVLGGGYTYYNFAGSLSPNYPGYLVWIGVIPLWVELGWFLVSCTAFIIFHDVLSPKKRVLTQAFFSGLFAVNIDLMIDPGASSNRLWVWLTPESSFLGVPYYNFLGWFLLIFFYDLTVCYTITNFRRMKILSAVEDRLTAIFMRLVPIERAVASYSMNRVKTFGFRLFVFEIVIIIGLKIASIVFSYLPSIGV